MSISKIALCNIALASLGEDSIRSFDEDNKRARMAEVFFNPVRDYLLNRYDWSFARRFKALQQLADAEVPSGYYMYALPSDCEKPIDLWPLGSKQWWDVYGRSLMCKQSSEAYIYYTSTDVSTTEYTSAFSMVLSTLLAVKMSPAITQDSKVTNALYSQYKNEIIECWASDANASNDHKPFDGDPHNDSFVNPNSTVIDSNGRL